MSPASRLDRATVLAIGWIAREVIHVGQILIRTAYGWWRWSEAHAPRSGKPQ